MNTWGAFMLGVIFGPAIWLAVVLVICAALPGGTVKTTYTKVRR